MTTTDLSKAVPPPTIDMPALPGRTLSQDELTVLVQELGCRPEQWGDRVAFDTGGRHFASLYRDEDVDVWLLCWNTVDDTGWHDHDTSSGAVTVTHGAVRETNPRLNGEPVTKVVQAGSTFSFGPEHIHRMAGAVDGSVTIHAYSPPLWRMGQYTFGADGSLRRRSLSYAEELRPVDLLERYTARAENCAALVPGQPQLDCVLEDPPALLRAVVPRLQHAFFTVADAALAAGGSEADGAQDHGFMYLRSFFDLDGHGWQVMWMIQAEAQHGPEKVGTGSSPSRGPRT